MISSDKYLKNPTTALPCNYLQYQTKAIIRNQLIILDEKFNPSLYPDFTDSLMLRLIHYLGFLKSSPLNRHLMIKTFDKNENLEGIDLFNDLYFLLKEIFFIPDEEYDAICKKLDDSDYEHPLCFLLYTTKMPKSIKNNTNLSNNIDNNNSLDAINNGKTMRKMHPIGLCMASFDKKLNEGFIEKIGVLKEYLNTDYRKILIEEILLRFANLDSSFVTINVDLSLEETLLVDDKTPILDKNKLDIICSNCGFEKPAIWHVLKKM